MLPAAQVPSLVDEHGYFTAAPQVLHARGFSEDEALAEVAAQLATARAHGLTITYLDTHMGVSWLGNLSARLADFAAREGLVNAATIPHLPPLRPAAPDPVSDLLGRLQIAAPGTYIYLNHPADDSAETRRWDAGVAPWRAAESRLWRSPRVRQAFTELGVCPCSYAALPGVGTPVSQAVL